MKELTKIPRVSEKQVVFGRRMGLDLSNLTANVAHARIEDVIDREFWSREVERATPKQIELAKEFGYDVLTESKRVASTMIADIMEQLNLESMEGQGLAPGVSVRNKWDRKSFIGLEIPKERFCP